MEEENKGFRSKFFALSRSKASSCELLGWVYKQNCNNSLGIFGHWKTFILVDEEQNKVTLHGQ